VRDVLRLHFGMKRSVRETGRSAGCGRTTAQNYINRALKNNLINWDEIEQLSDQELELRLGFLKPALIHGPRSRDEDRPMPDFTSIHRDLTTNKNVTLALLWAEYLEDHPSGYKYTQFCEYYNRWAEKLSVVMRQHHKAGEKAFVDYCDGIEITDPEMGKKISTQLFVGCLGASSYTFAEVTFTQELPNWIGSHVRMYEFFEGVAEITVPDNLKSGVIKPCFYEPVLNESYRELAAHYGTAIIPAHVRKPRHKAKVEAAVLVAQRWILACLRHRTFYSLQELNEAIQILLEKLNNRRMRHLKKSRLELYLEFERPALKALPERRYEFAEWEKATVNIDYHIEFDEHYYSVHYAHVHAKVMVRATAQVIEIFLKGERIASHRRSYAKWKHTTCETHMPEAHRARLKWPPSRLISWGRNLGPSVGILIEKILTSKKHPEQGYRSAMGIIRLEKKYGRSRLEKAARRALEVGVFSYRFVADMLKNNMDKLIASDDKQLPLIPREESNTRGRGYYH